MTPPRGTDRRNSPALLESVWRFHYAALALRAGLAIVCLIVALVLTPGASAPEPAREGQAVLLAQVQDPTGTADDADEGEDEEDVPIPPNLLEPGPNTPEPADTTDAKSAPPDTSGAAGRNPAAISLPTQPETLRYVPPGAAVGGADLPVPRPKPKSGLLGLTPMVVILSLVFVHIFVVRTVGD